MSIWDEMEKWSPGGFVADKVAKLVVPAADEVGSWFGHEKMDKTAASNDVLNGSKKLEDYTPYQQDQLAKYWTSDASFQQNLSDPQRNLLGRQLEVKNKIAEQNSSHFDKPLEWAGARFQWAMSETVSPSLSFLGIAAHHALYGYEKGEGMGLSDTWREAHHISPGQSLVLLGQSNTETAKKGFTIYGLGKKDTQGAFSGTPQARETSEQEAMKKAYFDKGSAKWISGTADFAVNWWLDPVVLLGKGLKATKAATYEKSVFEQKSGLARAGAFAEASAKEVVQARGNAAKAEQYQQKAEALAPAPGMIGARGKEQAVAEAQAAGLGTKRGFFTRAANAAAESRVGGRAQGLTPTLKAMRDHISQYKAEYSYDPNIAIYKLRSSMDTLTESSGGDVLAKALLAAKNDDELLKVLQASTGDAQALEELGKMSADLKAQLQVQNAAYRNLAQKYTNLPPAQQTAPFTQGRFIQMDMERIQAQVDALEEESRRIGTLADAQGKVRNLYFNQWLSPKVQKSREILKGDTVPSGIVSSALHGPIKMLNTTWNGIKPSGYIDIHGAESYRDFDAMLRSYRFDDETRQSLVGQYITASSGSRGSILLSAEAIAVKKVAEKYGVSEDMARALFNDYHEARKGAQTAMRDYSAAKLPGSELTVDKFKVMGTDGDGAAIVTHPLLESQALNNHVFMDMDRMEKILKENAKGLNLLQKGAGSAGEIAGNLAEVTQKWWNFATLLRVGYPIRAIADDFLGVNARFGAIATAMRATKGVYRSSWVRGHLARSDREADFAQADILDAHAQDLIEQAATAQKNIAKAEQRAVMHGIASPAKRRKSLQRADQLRQKYKEIQSELNDTRVASGNLRDKHLSTMKEQVFSRGTLLPGAYEGSEGSMFRDFNSSARSTANMLGRPADWYLRDARTAGWSRISYSTANEAAHTRAWLRDINNQIKNDRLAMELVRNGGDVNAAARWMASGEGHAYYHDRQIDVSREELAQRVNAHVELYLPQAAPQMAALRAKLLKEDLDGKDLKGIDADFRPEVNAELLQYTLGKGPAARAADATARGWYKIASEMPSQYLMKNPLFAQLYRGSVREQMAAFESQGITHLTEEMRQRLITNARSDALKSVKSFTYSMDHETKAAFGLKFIVPFFGAQQEGLNRWARIFRQNPDMVGRGVLLYTSPMRTGHAVDQDGDPVVGGYAIKQRKDPVTGKIITEKVLVSRNEIQVQVPDYLGGKALGKFFGGDGKTAVQVPLSSLNFTVPTDFGSLAAGPYAQVAANWFINSANEPLDKANRADLVDSIGKLIPGLTVLPYGPSDNLLETVSPGWARAIVQKGEHSEEYQKYMFDTMAAEDYRFHTGERKTAPKWSEIKERADHHWMLNLLSKESGFSPKAQNPYQFYVNESRKMQELHGPDEGRARYIQKYGDSAWNFSQSLRKNSFGIRSTKAGLQAYGEMKDVLQNLRNPELGALLMDVPGGDFDKNADFALRSAEGPIGSGENLVAKRGAREAWQDAQVNVGWVRYNSLMNNLDADLYSSGFTSYNDAGAEDLKERRDKVIDLFSTKAVNGKENPYYNPEWVKVFTTIDKGKYDDRASDLEDALKSPLLQAKAMDDNGAIGIRSDLVSLSLYLNARRDIQAQLSDRKDEGGSDDILAADNDDLREQISSIVDDLKERDTRFGDVFNRYFGSDMGYAQTTKERYASGEAQPPISQFNASAGLQQALNEIGGSYGG